MAYSIDRLTSSDEAKGDVRPILSVLNLGARENVAIVGGGGKTSLMFALAEALGSKGKRVVLSTTTKVWQGEAGRAPKIILFPYGDMVLEEIEEGLESHGHVFVGHSIIEPGKVKGITADQADELFEKDWIDYVIIEADGSKGRPLKVHAEHEPIVSRSSTLVIAVVGLDALGKDLGPDVVFRQELFMKLTGLKAGEKISEASMTEVFSSPDGLFKTAPPHARRVVFLNKIDALPDPGAARSLAGAIMGKTPGAPDLVVAGSIQKGGFSVYGKDK